MIKNLQLAFGLVLLIAVEVARLYFIMPFPGSQESETIDLAYFIHQNIFWFRTIGLLIILFPMVSIFMGGTTKAKVIASLGLIFYVVVVYLFNFRFAADQIFYQPTKVQVADSRANKIPLSNVVIGVSVGEEQRAYPIQLIGYHHQVRDTIAGQQIMVTYCTVCRTGRVFEPKVNGKMEQFRLVGMDHFNAMFEDEETGSWWRQVNGEAVTGPLKGSRLPQIESQQMTLDAWLRIYPNSKILQPDSTFAEAYEAMKPFERGKSKGALTKRDSLSWKPKSWIVGVQLGLTARAYDWNELVEKRLILDTLNGEAVAIVVEADSASFHVFKHDHTLSMQGDSALIDRQSGKVWDLRGLAINSTADDSRSLTVVQSSQEFWHSWKTFYPHTTRFVNGKVVPADQ
jgi:hypothetical protein